MDSTSTLASAPIILFTPVSWMGYNIIVQGKEKGKLMCESDSYKMLVKSCDNIANTLESIYEDNFVIEDEDDEYYDAHYYFDDDIYNLDYVWRKGCGLIGVRIMVACGGPNIWIDTMEEAVCGYWGADVYKAYLTTACKDAINNYFAEYAKEAIYYDKVD